jgi:fatty-acyl-CoA synthase
MGGESTAVLAGTPADHLRLHARHRPDARAVVDAGVERTLTFGELDARVNQLAHGLLGRGFVPGDRIALLATDSHRYLETVLACMRTGITYVPLNVRLVESEIAVLLARAGASALFASERYAELARRLRSELASPGLVILLADGAIGTSYEDLLTGNTPDDPALGVDPEATLGLAFTSGTTGTPKAVVQPVRMISAIATAGILDYEIGPDEFRYSAAPMFHVAGIGFPLMHLSRGIPSLVLPQFDAEAVLRWMQGDEITGCFLVPTMISTLLEQPDVHASRYERLDRIIYGAAAITPALLRRAMDAFGCDFVQAFGAGTEAGTQCCLSSADHQRALEGAEHLLGSIGLPAFGVELRILDENLEDVKVGEIGEIATRSAQVMTGYLGMPDETAEVFRGGWFRSGDLARQDADGYVYLAGRSKDMIVRGGENIFPIEIESVLMEHLAVIEAAVVGQPDEHWSEVVHAYVVVRNAAVGDEELRALCRERLAPHKVPVAFHFESELPRNASGKILKRVLREG